VSITNEPLISLGFTALEAEVYSHLLQESPITGYRIAQALKKPAPNIYKSLQSLEAKGAIMVDDGQNRLCRPVPPDELLAHLERRFQATRSEAARRLSEVTGADGDDRVYQLRSRDQVMERCRAMLRRCEKIALVDGFPGPIQALRPDLARLATRAMVAAKTYEPTKIPGVWIVEGVRSASTMERWPGAWITVVIDGAEQLIAFFSPDGEVQQAIWSASVHLSWVYHGALASEIILGAVERKIAEGASVEELGRILHTLSPLHALQAPGYQRLVRRFGAPSVGRDDESAGDPQ
jgi:predicted transcriptional regulator